MLIVPPPSPEITHGRSATLPLLLRGPRLPDGSIADVVVADGVIVSVATLAWNGAARSLAAGTTAIRVHVDVGQESGLRAVEALLEVQAGVRTRVRRRNRARGRGAGRPGRRRCHRS